MLPTAQADHPELLQCLQVWGAREEAVRLRLPTNSPGPAQLHEHDDRGAPARPENIEKRGRN